MSALVKYLLTGVVVAIAEGMALYKYWDYVTNPWTRDGQVRVGTTASFLVMTGTSGSEPQGPAVAVPRPQQ